MSKMQKVSVKNRIYLLAAFFVVSLLSYGENVVEIDLNSETVTATESLKVNYGEMELNITDVRRDSSSGKAYLNSKFSAKIFDPSGRVYFSGKKGEVALDGKSGDFYDNFGYVEISEVTGSEYPNDKIFFGGEHVNYNGKEIEINGGWLTTDPKVRESEDYNKGGYALIASNILIEPDKQVTLKEISLNRRGKSYDSLPFPWYRVNIRDNSEVPLFPTFLTSNEFGVESSVGVLWGNRGSAFTGGFAPKYAEKLGLLIGNLEGDYKSSSSGNFSLRLKDALLIKRDRDIDNRYHLTLGHSYNVENNKSEINFINSTVNLLDSYKNLTKIYKANDTFTKLGVKPLEYDDNLSFYTVESNFNLSDNSKLSLNIKDLINREAYDLLVYDELKTGNSEDHDLFNQVNYSKNLGDNKFVSYYSNLKDFSLGNQSSDSKSHEERYGVVLENSIDNYKLALTSESGDKLRPLTYIERWSGLTPLAINNSGVAIGSSITESHGTYALAAVPEYTVWDNNQVELKSKYFNINSELKVRAGSLYDKSNKRLSNIVDPLRKNVIKNSSRESELNRVNNLLEDNRETLSLWTDISSSDLTLTIAGGNTKRDLKDREGFHNYDNIIEGEGYRAFSSESNSVEYRVSTKEFDTSFGNYGLSFGNRYDSFSKLTGSEVSNLNNGDRVNSFGTITQKLEFTKDSSEKLENSFKLSGNIFTSSNKDTLRYEDNRITADNTLTFSDSDREAKYSVNLSNGFNSFDKSKNREYIGNSISLGDKFNSLEMKYNILNRFTNRTLLGERVKDLSVETYGLGVKTRNHSFGFSGNRLTNLVLDPMVIGGKGSDKSKEVVDENYISYGYKFANEDKLGFGYTFGRDKRDNLTSALSEIDTKKNSLGINYYDFGKTFDNTYSMELGTNRYGGVVNRSYSTDTLSLGWVFVDKSKDNSNLINYAMKEYDKGEDELTSDDLKAIEDLIAKRNSENRTSKLKFEFNSGWKKPVAFSGDYKRKFSINTYLESNKERNETISFGESIKKLSLTTGYSENRIGLGYTFTQDVKDVNNWNKSKENEHIVSINAKLGKPSEGYRVTAYGKVESESSKNGKYLGSVGVELGKEMGYYEWSLAFVREYNEASSEHDYTAAIQFRLLAIPKLTIFGFGVQDIKTGNRLSPVGSIFDGIEAEDAKVSN